MIKGHIPPVLVIGIDPGVDTGWCCYDVLHGEITEAMTISFWKAWNRASVLSPKQVLFIVEDPAQNKPVWNRNLDMKTNAKVAQNVGGNKREARLMIEGLRMLGFQVDARKPDTEKWSNNFFRSVTGYEKRASQHVRDAARLCYGVRTWPA